MREFIDHMRSHGNAPADSSEIIPTDGKFRRYQLEGDKKSDKVGYYRLTIDGDFAVGQHGNRRDSITYTWYSADNKEYTAEERELWKTKRIKAEADAAEQRTIYEAQAAREAAKRIKEAELATGEEGYLVKKGIKPHGIKKSASDKLLVYITNGEKIVNTQTIDQNGDKKFQYRARITGCYHPIAEKSESKDIIVICEGFATGASIREATGYPVIVAFNAGNLKPVAENIRKKYPKSRIIIAADNDAFTKTGNVGIEKAKEASAAINGYICWPEFEDNEETKYTDFNDAQRVKGMLYIAERVSDATPHSGTEAGGAQISLDGCTSDEIPASSAPPSQTEESWKNKIEWKHGFHGTVMDKRYKMINATMTMCHAPELAGIFAYDEFSQNMVINRQPYWDNGDDFKPRKMHNIDNIRIRLYLEKYQLQLSKEDTFAAAQAAADLNRINPVIDYLDSLVWDKQPRLDNWLIYYLGAEAQPKEYLRKIGPCWWIAAAKRVYKPGTPFHHMLILEGGQASWKSTTMKTIASFGFPELEDQYFTDRVSFDMIGEAKLVEMSIGKIILEFGEMTGFSKRDRHTMKQWITQASDEIQRKYQNETTTIPRQFVMVGTTNEDQYFKDPSGNRRFWPVRVAEHIDIVALKADVTQLWAEAVHRAKAGERHYMTDSDPVYKLMQEEQAVRIEEEVWSERVMNFVQNREQVKIPEILEECLKIPVERHDKRNSNVVGDILRNNGWYSGVIAVAGKRLRLWMPKKKAAAEENQEELEI